MSDADSGSVPGGSASVSVLTKECVACGETITGSATLCRHCKSDQSAWRNELRYWAGVAGIVTLVASGLTFTANLGFQLWQRFFGHEIAITNLDPFGKTKAWNLTASPIYLRTINVTSAAPKNDLVWEVHQTVPANDNVEIELLGVARGSWYGLPGDMFGRTPAEYAQLEPAEFTELTGNMHTDMYVPTFLMPDSESFTQLKRVMKTRFQTFDCRTTITFVRLADGSSSSIDVPCRGAFRRRHSASSR